MNVQELVETIKKIGQHSYIYHFTDECNFPQIKKYGLLSKNRMRELDIWPEAPSGNQWSWDADDSKGISDYVSLCMTRNHPMKYIATTDGRIQKPRYLCISPEVLLTDGVLFAADIANKAGIALTDLRSSISTMDIEVLYERTDWKDATVQSRLSAVDRYEILVPREIAINAIPRVF